MNRILFFRSDNNVHVAPFHLGSHLNSTDILEFGGKTFQGLQPQFVVSNFPATENYRYLGLISFLKEPASMLYLEKNVMVVGFGSKLDLFQLDLYLLFSCLLLSFALLVLELSIIHDPADRRNGSG